jgi:hypothetical protein
MRHRRRGPGPVGSATIDLDRPTPSIAYETPTGEPIKRLAFKLEKGVDQFLIININAKSKRNHVSWAASLLLLVDGVRRPVPLQDPDNARAVQHNTYRKWHRDLGLGKRPLDSQRLGNAHRR